MAKNCAICGASINVFQSQKLADGNYLCRKVCCKKALTKYFDFVNATLPEYKDHAAQVERGTKIWEGLFVPRLKSKDKNEKLERRYQPMIVAPSLGLVALLETRYKFMNFGKSEHACVFRLDDLVCYETEKETKTVNDKEQTEYYIHYACSERSSETSSNSSDDVSSDEDEQGDIKLSSLHKAIDESSHYIYPMTSEKDGRSDDSSIYVDDSSENYDNDVIIAYGLLSEADEVRYYMEMGMSLQYTGQTQIIDGRLCWIFALGTEHDEQFVREFYYGVCDNLIYSYDALNDTWNVLGAG